MNSLNLTASYPERNAGYDLTEKLLGLTVSQLVRLLICEVDAKNEAYSFILKKGLMDDFLNPVEER